MLIFLNKTTFKVTVTSNYIFIFTEYEHLNISYLKKYQLRIIADMLKNPPGNGRLHRYNSSNIIKVYHGATI